MSTQDFSQAIVLLDQCMLSYAKDFQPEEVPRDSKVFEVHVQPTFVMAMPNAATIAAHKATVKAGKEVSRRGNTMKW